MTIQEIAEQLVQERSSELTKGCRPCRRFVGRLKRRPALQVGWDEVPRELLARFATRARQRMFQS